MSDSELDDDLILALGSFLCLQKNKKKRRPRKTRVNPYLKNRKTKGRFFVDVQDMRMNPPLFKEIFRMMPAQFDLLLRLLESKYQPKVNRRPNDSISLEERLCITLEFLASGSQQRHIASIYRVIKQWLGPIIEETCVQIYEVLKDLHITSVTEENWTAIANSFHSKWNFPNCLGAIDGKHIAIKASDNAASLFYNYKGYHSIVLMAVADANYKFSYVDIGGYGSEGDSGVFQSCAFGKALQKSELNIPNERHIGGALIPHVFLADDAFPLHRHIMKPYKPAVKGTPLEDEERMFNYRLSRARRCVENAFGIMCARWIVLARTMFVNPTRAQKIVAACCVLHNFLLKESKNEYCPSGFDDSYDEDGGFIDGNWRKIIPETSMMNTAIPREIMMRPPKAAKIIRDTLKEYLNSTVGSLAWQRKAVFLE